MMKTLPLLAVVLVLAAGPSFCADSPADIRELKLRDWEPRSMMVTKVFKSLSPLSRKAPKTPGNPGVFTFLAHCSKCPEMPRNALWR
jgi:hypothetical protein